MTAPDIGWRHPWVVQATGEGGDRIVCDDPNNVNEVESDSVRKSTNDWFDVVMSTRVNDPRTAAKVAVMQRCHEQDLSGHLLEQGGWEHLCLPAEFEGARPVTSIGWSDPRSEHGELLWPDRFGAAEIQSLKRSLGSYAAAGQLQQRPSPAEGGLLKRHWFRFWQLPGANSPAVVVRLPDLTLQSVAPTTFTVHDEVIQSWDCSFKDLATSDYVVGQVWTRAGADFLLLHQQRAKMDCPATVQAVRRVSRRFPTAVAKADRRQGQRVGGDPNACSRDSRDFAHQPRGRKVGAGRGHQPTH
jgi:phage terminase large subunit-like protein